MLVLSRQKSEVILIGKAGQTITLSEPIEIKVTDIRFSRNGHFPAKAKIGIKAPSDVVVFREELVRPIEE